VVFLRQLVARRADLERVRAGEHRGRRIVRAVVLQLCEPDILSLPEDVGENVVGEVFHVEYALGTVRHRAPCFPCDVFVQAV
jgi:hypothetical protein